MNTWGGHPLGHITHMSCMPKPWDKKNMIGPFIGANNSPPPNETWGQSLPPWNPSGLKQLVRSLGEYTMECINWRGCPAWAYVMWRWHRMSVRRSSTQLRSTFGIGGNVPSWRRSQDKDPPALPGQTPSQSSSRGSMPPTTTSGI